MTKRSTPTEATNQPGSFVLPDESEFDNQVPDRLEDDDGPPPGRVLDLDYDKWAAATLSLDMAQERLESHRIRLERKGYRKLDGNPIVVGFDRAEVWVMPRAKYEARREARARRIREAVDRGDMTEFALPREHVIKSRPGVAA